MSMTISAHLFSKWYKYVENNLECMKKERKDFEKIHNEGIDKNVYLLPHEFLFLLCNSLNRLDLINKVH